MSDTPRPDRPVPSGDGRTDDLPYDALLLVSFGGPEGPDDVLPFMENVTRGRGIPRERLVEVSAHYALFGGVSPINGQNRALIAALESELDAHGPHLPVYWGNRNWTPYLADAIHAMQSDGVRRALAFVTSAYSSYSGCRQYREDIERARAEVAERTGVEAPVVDKIRVFYNHPGFVEPMVDNVLAGLEALRAAGTPATHLAFCAHSVPQSYADTSDYVVQLQEASRLVAEGAAARDERAALPWRLVYQSRSGAPGQPWLEPDIGDHLEELHGAGAGAVLMVPIGFISDHMEVVYDLDTQAVERAASLRLPVQRAATVGTDPRFVVMIRDLVRERIELVQGLQPMRACLGERGPNHDVCPLDCCPAPARPAGPPPGVAGRPGAGGPGAGGPGAGGRPGSGRP